MILLQVESFIEKLKMPNKRSPKDKIKLKFKEKSMEVIQLLENRLNQGDITEKESEEMLLSFGLDILEDVRTKYPDIFEKLDHAMEDTPVEALIDYRYPMAVGG